MVTDENGIPIPGVNVLIKGTDKETQTNFDGEYALEATPGEVIVFSFIGITTVEKPVGLL